MKEIKSQKLVIGILVMGIISLSIISYNIYQNKGVKHLEKYTKETYAMMLQDEDDKNNYIEYFSSEWPQMGYMYNSEGTTCYDNKDTILENDGLIWYSNRNKEAHLTNDKTTYCYLYFNIDNTAPVVNSYYIKTSEKYTSKVKYTNTLSNRIVFSWNDNDVESYCITNSNDASTCNWESTTDRYEGDKLVEEGNQRSVDKNYNLPDVSDQVVTMYVFLKDFAGNISGTTSVSTDSIWLDRTKPECEISVSDADGQNNWNLNNVTVTMTKRDSSSGLTDDYGFTTNSSESYSSSSLSATQSDTKGITYYGYVKDKAGNKNSCHSREIKVDTVDPECNPIKTITDTTDGVAVNPNCTDDTSGIPIGGCNYENAAVTELKSNTTYKVRDDSGRTSSCSVTITATTWYRTRTRSWNNCKTGDPNECVNWGTKCVSWGSKCVSWGTKCGGGYYAGNACPSTHQYCGNYGPSCCNAGRQYINVGSYWKCTSWTSECTGWDTDWNNCTGTEPDCKERKNTCQGGWNNWNSWSSYNLSSCSPGDTRQCESQVRYT